MKKTRMSRQGGQRKSVVTVTYRNMKYAFYKGCLIPYRIHYYESSARKILTDFGIELVDFDFGCCGSQILESRNHDLWLAVAARNIALAEKYNLDILTLCGSCTSTLSRVKWLLENDRGKNDLVNGVLDRLGLEFKGTSKIVHILKLLVEEIGINKLKGFIKKELDLKAAFQHPCQVYRPERQMNVSMGGVKELLAVFLPDVYEMDTCCGESLIATDQDLCINILKQNLSSVKAEGSDIIITACGNCQMTYDVNQKSLKNKNEIKRTVPSLLISQALGIAMGYGYSEVGLSQNLIKVDPDIFI